MFYLDLGLDLYAPGGTEFLREIGQFLKIERKWKVLEVGASSAFGSRFLAKNYGCSVVATDINPAWVPRIQARVKEEGLRGKVAARAADVLKLPFRKDSFNAVLANGVLYLTDKASALRQINRVLKKGGFLALGEPIWLKDDVPHNLRRVLEVDGAEALTEVKYQRLFTENGFSLVFRRLYDVPLWENYYLPLQKRISEWQEQKSPNLTKYSTEIEIVLDEMGKVRQVGPGNLGYILLIGKKTAPATLELLEKLETAKASATTFSAQTRQSLIRA